MEEREEPRNNLMRRLQSSFATSSSSIPNIFDLSQLNSSQISSPPNFSQHLSSDNNKRPGIPPSHPNLVPSSHYSQFSPSRSPTPPSHSRSLSQPAFFSFDSLPPLSPSPYREASSPSLSDPISADVSMEDRDGRSTSVRIGESLPPRKAHRRSHSEIPFVFSSSPSPPLLAHRSQGFLGRSASVRETSGTNRPNQFVKQEIDWDKDGNIEGTGERKSEGESGDDLLSAYMNLDNIDVLNTSGTEDKNGQESREDLDSRASVTKNNGVDGSDNEVDSSANRSLSHSSVVEKKEGNKRGAGDSANLNERSSRHFRSISMDSFMGRMQNFGDESPKLNPSPELATNSKSMTNPINGSLPSFNLEFANGEFSPAELKKIMANEKLTEIAMSDPKRAKRILANRQSAARSKERKMQYISELEHKVQTLQTEATTLSAQLTLLQRDSAGLTTQNNELKFRLQAMEQQAKLRDALNEALTAEVQRLKLVTGTQTGETHLSGNLSQQLMMNSHIFQMHQQPRTANHFPNFQSSPPSQNPPTSKSESNQ